MAVIDAYLSQMVENEGSDLHLSSKHPPFWRLQGRIMPIDASLPPLSSDDILSLIREIMPPENYKELLSHGDTDCAYALDGVGRFRLNGFRDMNGYGAVMRHIPQKIPTFEELLLPESIRAFCLLSKGLVIVTGPTGSGKSTTLAAMIDYINRNRQEHVITIEDPIEFVHVSGKCLVNQREAHRDTRSFATALRAALREDPDIVLVGEIRDIETMQIAIETAETGHLVFATLHTNTAITTVARIIDLFPGDRQNQIRSMLADTLKGIVAQVLCPGVNGRRVGAFEVLMVNTPVAALIREAKTHMLLSVMQTSRGEGMQTFNDALGRLVAQGRVAPVDAYVKAIDKEGMEHKFKELGVSLDFKAEASDSAREARRSLALQTLEELRDTLKNSPEDLEAMASLAWMLATSSFAELRDGKAALRLAERANSLTKGKDPGVLSILGAAQAECGSFRRAIAATRDALRIHEEHDNKAGSIMLNAYLREYENLKPHREE